MSINPPVNNVVRNQSHIRYSFGENSFVTYSNITDTPLVGPQLSITKGTAAVEAQPGAPVAFYAVIANTGNRAADVTLYDLLPGSTQFVPNSVSRDQVPIPGADLAAGYHLGLIYPGTQTVIAYQLMVSATSTAGQLVNRLLARYVFTSGDGRLVDGEVLSNEVSIAVDPVSGVELAVVLSVDKSRAAPGEALRYTLLIVNQGVLSAEVTAFIPIPEGTLFVPNSLTVNGILRSGSFPPSGISLGILLPQGEVTVSFEVTVPGYGTAYPGLILQDQANVTATYTLPDRQEIETEQIVSNPVSTTLYFPVFQVDISAMPGIVAPEEPVDLIVTIINTGNLEAVADLGRLIPGQLILVPGSFRINGTSAPDPGRDGLLGLTVVSPQQRLVITYRAIVSPFIVSPTLTGSVVLYYTFTLNGNVFRGEVSSNLYRLIVETLDE
ncbi:hypothetical protein [Paenibacillus mesotrionivorans]|uniref:Uncharacterized protein n=1 Tax=Paenibacillus mesotrionivorans TaxID=3160968 RepID=A0ACC7P4I1_9BACL